MSEVFKYKKYLYSWQAKDLKLENYYFCFKFRIINYFIILLQWFLYCFKRLSLLSKETILFYFILAY